MALGWRDSIWAILAAHVFFNTAVVVRTVGTLWSRLDPDLAAAAQVLGAGPWEAFRKITLPLLKPAIAAGSLNRLPVHVHVLRGDSHSWRIPLCDS